MQFWLGRVDAALVSGDRALEYARRSGDRDFERKALLVLGNAKVHGSTPWRGVEEHVAQLRSLGLPSEGLASAAAAAQGRFEESRALSEKLVRDSFERGARVRALSQAMGSGWFEMLDGELARGIEQLHEAWVGLGELGEQGYRATIAAIYADLLARAGRANEADEVLLEVDATMSPDD